MPLHNSKIRPFFTFYGGKYRIAPYYPKPLHNVIVEPFCGSAGYSLRHYNLKVRLYDIDPIIVGVWDYLIRSSAAEIMSLPSFVDHVDNVKACQEARWLIGFCLNKANTSPRKSPSAWMRKLDPSRLDSFWGDGRKERIASQVDKIKHWTIEQRDFLGISNDRATWFIDPPYHRSGHYYKFNRMDYSILAGWCKDRLGQTIVCEQSGAQWLPFEFFREIKTVEGPRGKAKGIEVMWTNGEP